VQHLLVITAGSQGGAEFLCVGLGLTHFWWTVVVAVNISSEAWRQSSDPSSSLWRCSPEELSLIQWRTDSSFNVFIRQRVCQGSVVLLSGEEGCSHRFTNQSCFHAGMSLSIHPRMFIIVLILDLLVFSLNLMKPYLPPPSTEQMLSGWQTKDCSIHGLGHKHRDHVVSSHRKLKGPPCWCYCERILFIISESCQQFFPLFYATHKTPIVPHGIISDDIWIFCKYAKHSSRWTISCCWTSPSVT